MATDATLYRTNEFEPSAPDRMKSNPLRNTVIENVPQISVRRAPPQPPKDRTGVISPMSDDFPTPKAIPPNTGNSNSSSSTISWIPVADVPASPASSDTQSDGSSLWSKRSSRSEFDEMYDVSGSESEELPIKLSSSVKKRIRMASARKLQRYPSIQIPSPSEWPTIEKLKSATTLSPPIRVQLSPAAIKQLKERNLRVPSTSSTPSLDGDGSETSDDVVLSSCPSTPDPQQQEGDENAWEGQIQLDPSALSVLQHLQPEDDQQLETVLEVPEEAMEEMREILESPPMSIRLKTDMRRLEPTSAGDADDELSALSVPSPGGFFASLDSSVSRHTWGETEPTPTTSTATEFYTVPFRSPRLSRLSRIPTGTAHSFYAASWRERPDNATEHTISIASPGSERQDPITARKVVFSPTDIVTEVDEIDENYEDVLKQAADAHVDRTQLWLCTQKAYLEAISGDEGVVESFKEIPDAVPKTPDVASPQSAGNSPESKKSVRFADAVPPSKIKAKPTLLEKPPSPTRKRISPIHDGTFWEGWRHTKRSQRARDVFQHRQARAEAAHVRRVSQQRAHLEQLAGRYELTAEERPAPPRPISTLLPEPTEDEKKEVIAKAERERQALEQLHPSVWQLSAQKELNGGSLLTSPIVGSFKNRRDVCILDLAGQVHCSWAWDVALTHPKATVYTTVSSDAEAHVAESSLDGPLNHSVVAAPKPWELPFEDRCFDVLSARNLYGHLRTITPKGESADEWDLTLQECLRVLKPGGYLEFDLMDAELVHPDSAGQALSVEFAFNLRTRGYDPCAGKSFLPRLKRAGFQEIKRAWMILPVADVVPRWTDSGKTPGSTGTAGGSNGSNGSTATVTPGNGREDYFGDTALPERVIGPNGTVTELQQYEPPVTGSTRDVKALTGIVGARMWEQWILKLNSEMGRSEERCLEGVAKALEEGGKGNAGWRCLVGWARKAP